MSRSDPKEAVASAAVTKLALFRDRDQGEPEMPGASGWSGLADHGVVITGSASSSPLSSSSSSYRSTPTPASQSRSRFPQSPWFSHGQADHHASKREIALFTIVYIPSSHPLSLISPPVLVSYLSFNLTKPQTLGRPREKASTPHTYAHNRPRHPCRRSSSNAPPCWHWPASSP